MSIYYIERKSFNNLKQTVTCFYREDLELVYHNDYPIHQSEINLSLLSVPLPYLIKDGDFEEILTFGAKENWKEKLIASRENSNKLIIAPLTVEKYEKDFAQTIFYIIELGTKTEIYSTYKQDLKEIYPDSEIFEKKYGYGFHLNLRSLPYIIYDGKRRIVLEKPVIKSSWKEDLVVRYKEKGSRISIHPYSLTKLDQANTVYYVREMETKTEIYSVFMQDLKTLYPDHEIFDKKCDYSLNFKQRALPYIIKEGRSRTLLEKPSIKFYWKEDLINFYKDKGSKISIYPYSLAKLEADHAFVENEWKKSVGDKVREDPEDEQEYFGPSEDEYFANEDNYSDPRYCSSCGESPCMCSDPERTSTISYY